MLKYRNDIRFNNHDNRYTYIYIVVFRIWMDGGNPNGTISMELDRSRRQHDGDATRKTRFFWEKRLRNRATDARTHNPWMLQALLRIQPGGETKMSTKTTRSTRVNPPCLERCHEGMNASNGRRRRRRRVSRQPLLETNAELFIGNLLLLFRPPSPHVLCTLNLFRRGKNRMENDPTKIARVKR